MGAAGAVEAIFTVLAIHHVSCVTVLPDYHDHMFVCFPYANAALCGTGSDSVLCLKASCGFFFFLLFLREIFCFLKGRCTSHVKLAQR